MRNIIAIGDDVEAFKILNEHGMLAELEIELEGSLNEKLVFFERDGMTCAGLRFWGNDEPSENGYCVYMIETDESFTKEDAMQLF
jgi:hypothetical protein